MANVRNSHTIVTAFKVFGAENEIFDLQAHPFMTKFSVFSAIDV